LELDVKVINIKEGRNEEMVRRCSKLHEYSAFMARIYEYKEKMGNLEEAIKEAIKYCHKHDILKEYLEIYGSEVLNMLYTEFNIEDAKEVWQEEAHEKGREEGREEGREAGRTEEKLGIARNLLIRGETPDFVQEITGLDLETIQSLKK